MVMKKRVLHQIILYIYLSVNFRVALKLNNKAIISYQKPPHFLGVLLCNL